MHKSTTYSFSLPQFIETIMSASDTQTQNQITQQKAEKDRQLEKCLEKFDHKTQEFKNKVFVLANLYYFLQGTILTVASQLSSPKCRHWSFFSVLSVIAFFLIGVPLVYMMCMYVEAKNERDVYEWLRQRRRVDDEPVRREEKWYEDYRAMIRYVIVVVVVVFLVWFNVTILYGVRSLLCENGDIIKIHDVGFDCFKVCSYEDKCLSVCTNS